ncbi:MAG: beta-ketoacyl-[acyl-carrier-protein] synthase family protein [Acidobacteriota bacterium]|nr:beta-ketoacyl-[acyl-carrier-protein] synthase family protein [Acidobacteriota bacterium]
MKAVAITGMGVVSSLGLELDELFGKLDRAFVQVEPAPWVDEYDVGHSWASMVQEFEPTDWMSARVAAGTDPFAQYAIAAAVKAMESAGVDEPDPLRTAVVVGTSMAGVETLADSQRGLDSVGIEGVSRKFQIQVWPNMAAGQIALHWRLHGPLLTICTACASALDAVGIAARMIEDGTVDLAIAGGCDRVRSEVAAIAAIRYGMAEDQPDPYRACRPFDIDRTGVMTGEGAGMVVLERAADALARGAQVHATVRGYANVSDGFHPSSPDPTGQWERRAMELAQQSAGTSAEDIDAVIAHGTGTPVGDTAEMRAINDLFGRDDLAVASIKGHLGHTAGAAGVMNLLAAIHSMDNGAVIPTAGTTEVDPEARFHVVTSDPYATRVDTVQVNAFGFGGQDASMVVSRG